jgi:SAM-dependent methyltransferase
LRQQVFQSDRIKVTENFLKNLYVEKVLELGAGDYSFEYTKQSQKVFWVKVDFLGQCTVKCELNSETVVLPFADATFDLVICTEIIEHMLWPQQLLSEVYRVLIPHGSMLISIPNVTSFSYRIGWLLGHLPSCAASGNLPSQLDSLAYEREGGSLLGGHVVDFNMKRLLRLLEFSGFVVSRMKGSGVIWYKQILPHWCLPPSFASNIICLARKIR